MSDAKFEYDVELRAVDSGRSVRIEYGMLAWTSQVCDALGLTRPRQNRLLVTFLAKQALVGDENGIIHALPLQEGGQIQIGLSGHALQVDALRQIEPRTWRREWPDVGLATCLALTGLLSALVAAVPVSAPPEYVLIPPEGGESPSPEPAPWVEFLPPPAPVPDEPQGDGSGLEGASDASAEGAAESATDADDGAADVDDAETAEAAELPMGHEFAIKGVASLMSGKPLRISDSGDSPASRNPVARTLRAPSIRRKSGGGAGKGKGGEGSGDGGAGLGRRVELGPQIRHVVIRARAQTGQFFGGRACFASELDGFSLHLVARDQSSGTLYAAGEGECPGWDHHRLEGLVWKVVPCTEGS